MLTLMTVAGWVLWGLGSLVGLVLVYGLLRGIAEDIAYSRLEQKDRVKTFERHTSSIALDMYGDTDPDRCFYTETYDPVAKEKSERIARWVGASVTLPAFIAWILWWFL